MSQYTKYKLYKLQQRVSGSSDPWVDVIPTTYSYNANGTQTPVVVESASTDCGYVPPVEPIYEWRNIPISQGYECDECPLTRWVASGYTCSGTTKMTKEIKQASYDSGTTWEDMVPEQSRAALPVISYYSTDCGYVPQYLTFVATESGTFKLSGNNINYSVDSGETWTQLPNNTDSPTVQAGSTIMWKASGLTSLNGVGTFSSSGKFDVEGNPMSLLFGDDFASQTSLIGKSSAFRSLFRGCTNLENAEDLLLPAITLESNCYSYMFEGCTNLTTTPKLIATTLGFRCYFDMFKDCTSLTIAPELPATTLANGCYGYMFEGCTALTTPPELPATTLASECYQSMFYNCTSLTTAPELPATTLATYCYGYMFRGCTSLTTAPELPAETLANGCYSQMFYSCRSLNSITCLATDISATNCTSNWVSGVASSGTFVMHTDMGTTWTRGVNGVPNNWTITSANS